MPNFDRYASTYDVVLSRALSLSGESKEYFARARVEYLTGCLAGAHASVRSVLDFGCGTGSGSRVLAERLRADVLGVDVSARSVSEARDAYPDGRFLTLDQYVPAAEFDLVFCNGVFHHIPPGDRAAALDVVLRSLRPGGLFALWENNPWNPGTRYSMARCEFDRDAVTLSARQAGRLVRAASFHVLRTDFMFIFPRLLRALRRFESPLSRWPLGAQYQVLCRR
jgi:SAM-dependent methyltransferase